MCCSSGGLIRNTTGVTTAPARQIALQVMPTSGQFAISTTTRSPADTPSFTSPPDTRQARSNRSPER